MDTDRWSNKSRNDLPPTIQAWASPAAIRVPVLGMDNGVLEMGATVLECQRYGHNLAGVAGDGTGIGHGGAYGWH